MSWLKDILLELAKKVTAKNAFILLMTVIVFTGIYFLADRFFDYKQASAVGEKVQIEKTKPEGISFMEYSENLRKYDLDNKAKQTNN